MQLRSLRQMVNEGPQFMSRLHIDRDVKPAEDFPVPPGLDSLTPIRCVDLAPNTTHRSALEQTGSACAGCLVVMFGMHQRLA